jgi:hypothetical protein
MTPPLERMATDPDLLMVTVFVACLVGAGLFAAVWAVLFSQGERRLRRRADRLHGRRAGGESNR